MATNAMVRPGYRPARLAKEVGLWALQGLGAYEFLQAGSAKLLSAPMMVQAFAAIGAGQWFRYFTGGLEVLGALALLVPGLSGYGAAILAVVMGGAVATHLLILGGSPALPLALLVAMALVAWARLRQGRRA
jgi:putative oxidoreductase